MSKRLVKGHAAREGSSAPPTKGQMRTLIAFKELVSKLKRSPTKRELSEYMGLTESGCQGHLGALAAMGALEEEKELVVKGRKMTAHGEALIKLFGSGN